MQASAPTTSLRHLSPEALPPLTENLIDFISWLGQPSAITIPGKDPTRVRFICTLLHGNEPSGTHAIHRWLQAWQSNPTPPATQIIFLLANIEASLLKPHFTHRQFPEGRDLNRCFSEPKKDAEGLLAANILAFIHQQQPEAILDLHNTSGAGPAFAVSTVLDTKHQTLASFFTNQMVFTDLKLGALMELGEHFTPTVTIECGGAHDETAHTLALAGLNRFLTAPDVFKGDQERLPITVFKHPLRLKVHPGGTISYQPPTQWSGVSNADLTLPTDAESLNYGPIGAGKKLGWLGQKGLSALTAQTPTGLEQIHQYFLATPEHFLVTRQRLQLFMVTPRADIACSDCIFYFAPL